MKVKLTLTIAEMTENERKLDILISDESIIDKLVNIIYPPRNRDAYGFVRLVNFLYKENN